MPEHPLIVFPKPEAASRSNLPSGGGGFRRPSHDRQGQRLTPLFNQLQDAFNARRVEVQQAITGADPEQVLVIETLGAVENFANAIKRIEGLEWLGEIELEEIEPDEDFYDESNPEKSLSGRLYVVMSNQRALEEMLSLWRRYQQDSTMRFPRGMTRFREVFDTLKTLRRWDVQDRLLETGILDIWQEELSHDGDGFLGFEAELWYRGSQQKQEESLATVKRTIEDLGGRLVTQSIVPEVSYHGILGELPRNAIQILLSDHNIEMVKCDDIMFFRPVGQISSGDREIAGEFERADFAEKAAPSGEPIVAVLDGLPLENHSLLGGRLLVDDPDGWEAQYPGHERVHGTAMTSLLVHGDLNANESALESPVYVRPIMRPDDHSWHTPRPECMPRNELPVDLIHRAIRRLFESIGGQDPVAPSVKIVNLSIGDYSRQFTRMMSPLGRLLDWLSVKYDVLFVVSAGNCRDSIESGIGEPIFDGLTLVDRESTVVRLILAGGRFRRLLSPAESINALTVGASHCDYSTALPSGNRIDLFTRELPSPVSPLGTGYRRSVKPEIIYEGGKQLYRKNPLNGAVNLKLDIAPAVVAPGNRAAAPGLPGVTNATSHSVGTSNATCLVSRNAAQLFTVLEDVFSTQPPEFDCRRCFVPLLKASLVHGATWADMGDCIEQIIRPGSDARQVKNLLTRWLGYGKPDFRRMKSCSAQRATVLGCGELSDGQGHVFSVPLPPSLSSRREWRRLTVTLAWLSPIAPKTQKYRASSLWFEVSNKDLAVARMAADWQAVRRGTVQHEIFEGESAVPIAEGDVLTVKVNCRSDATRVLEAIQYGLVVSLEVAEGIDIAVYDEVRSRIAVPIGVQTGTQGNS